MAAFIAGLFGGGSSSSSSTTIDTTETNQDITNILQNFSSTVSNVVNASQNITFDSSVTCGGDLNINESMDINTKFVGQITDTQRQSIVNQLQTLVNNAAASDSSLTAGFLSSPVSGQSVANITTTVNNLISSTLTTNTLNAIFTSVNPNQKIVLKGPVVVAHNCNVTENLLLSVAAQEIIDQLSDAAVGNTTIDQIKNSAAATQQSTSTGPIQEIGDAINSFLKSFGWILLILVGGFILFFVLGGGKLISGLLGVSSGDEDDQSKQQQQYYGGSSYPGSNPYGYQSGAYGYGSASYGYPGYSNPSRYSSPSYSNPGYSSASYSNPSAYASSAQTQKQQANQGQQRQQQLQQLTEGTKSTVISSTPTNTTRVNTTRSTTTSSNGTKTNVIKTNSIKTP